jgi:hypothetical protein
MSFASTVEIHPKDFLLFTENEFIQVSDTFISSTASRQENDEKIQNILTHLVRNVAYTECKKYQCGDKKCSDFSDFSLEIRKIGENSIQRRIDIDSDSNQIVLYPDFQSNSNQLHRSRDAWYLSELRCTNDFINQDLASVNSNGLIILKDLESQSNQTQIAESNFERDQVFQIIDQVGSSVVSEISDWGSITAGLIRGAASSVFSGYHGLKDTLKYCPKEAMQSCFYRGISIVSFGASSWATEQAKKVSDTIAILKATKGKGEPHEYRIHRLQIQYLQQKEQFSKEDQDKVESIFATIPARQLFDYQGELPRLLDRIENILLLPHSPNRISAHREGEDLRKILQDLHYPDSFVESAYKSAALMDVSTRYGIFIPIRPIYILGDPGVGKTHFVEQVARALHSPLCMIKIKKIDSAVEELLGSTSSYSAQGYTGPANGLLADCLIHQKDADGNAVRERINNPILFFDELDRVLNSSTAGALRAQLLSFFNNSEKDRTLKVAGLQNITIDLSRSLIFIAANGYIHPETEIKPAPGNLTSQPEKESAPPQKEEQDHPFDLAFKSRLDVVKMRPVGKKEKKAIGNDFLEQAMRQFGFADLDSDIRETHQKIINFDTEKGVRVMKSLIFENVATQAARRLGWTLKVMDVKAEYSGGDEPSLNGTSSVQPIPVQNLESEEEKKEHSDDSEEEGDWENWN